eukprot:3531270-Pyramimonas_sp.AAC.1
MAHQVVKGTVDLMQGMDPDNFAAVTLHDDSANSPALWPANGQFLRSNSMSSFGDLILKSDLITAVNKPRNKSRKTPTASPARVSGQERFGNKWAKASRKALNKAKGSIMDRVTGVVRHSFLGSQGVIGLDKLLGTEGVFDDKVKLKALKSSKALKNSKA